MSRGGRRRIALAAAVALLPLAVPGAALAAVPNAPTAPNAMAAQRTWHGDQLRQPAAVGAGRGGAGVLVAVLDTWVDRAHPDLQGRALAGADCTSGTCVPGMQRDECQHGTHVAGTIASSSYGVAPKAKLLPVRVLRHDAEDDTCNGDPDHVAAGVRWAVSQGADVLNLSLGPDVAGETDRSQLPAALAEAAAAGVLVVTSAGNGQDAVVESYGGAALVVAATRRDGELASYSQHGDGVDVAAPGGDTGRGRQCTQDQCITSLFPDGRYAVAAGTSMAAPAVSGVAALLLAQDPRRTRADLVKRLRSTARPLSGAGAGVVDAAAALGVRHAVTPPPKPRAAQRAARPAAPVQKAAAGSSPTRPVARVTSKPSAAGARPSPSVSAPAPAPARALPVPIRPLRPVARPAAVPPGWPVPVATALVVLGWVVVLRSTGGRAAA